MWVKWALGSITTNKASEIDGIPAELFQILKGDAIKVLPSVCQQIWETQQFQRTGRSQFSFQIPKGNAKECLNYCTIALIQHVSKSFKLGFSSPWTKNFQMHKLDLEKAEEPEIKLPTFTES